MYMINAWNGRSSFLVSHGEWNWQPIGGHLRLEFGTSIVTMDKRKSGLLLVVHVVPSSKWTRIAWMGEITLLCHVAEWIGNQYKLVFLLRFQGPHLKKNVNLTLDWWLSRLRCEGTSSTYFLYTGRWATQLTTFEEARKTHIDNKHVERGVSFLTHMTKCLGLELVPFWAGLN